MLIDGNRMEVPMVVHFDPDMSMTESASMQPVIRYFMLPFNLELLVDLNG